MATKHVATRLWTFRLKAYGLKPVMAKPSISSLTTAFGARVRARRLELDLSQERLADACGLHWSFVGQVERGQRNITLFSIIRLAQGLQLDPGDLVRGLRVPEGEARSG